VLIRGVARSHDGSLLEDAVVSITDAPTDVPDIAAVTGDDGTFVMAAPVAGRYRLGVRADGHVLGTFDVSVAVDDVNVSCNLVRDPPD
jgi:hypothetical protein